MDRRFKTVLALMIVGALAAPAMAQKAAEKAVEPAVTFVPHRAVYDMRLEIARSGSGLTDLQGRMVYELTGSACAGYTQTMRFVTKMSTQNGEQSLTDLRSKTWEDASAAKFTFETTQIKDQGAGEVTAGEANRTPADVKIDLTRPAKKSFPLPAKTHFPMQHSTALIEAARAGKTLLRADIYDASEKGDKVYETSAVIGRKAAADANKQLRPVKNAEALDAVAAWPIAISYFERGAEKKDATPSYELSYLFFENGVSRRLLIDYGEFAMRGDLKELTFLDVTKCEPKKP